MHEAEFIGKIRLLGVGTSHITFDLCCIFKNLIHVPVSCFEKPGFGGKRCRLLCPKLKIASEWLGTKIEFLIFR
jgi:hypothetical protein